MRFANVAIAVGMFAALTGLLYGRVQVVSEAEWKANKANFEAPKREAIKTQEEDA